MKRRTSAEIVRDLDELLDLAADIDEPLDELWQKIGTQNLLHVLDTLGGPAGMQVYVPNRDNFIEHHRRRMRDPDVARCFNAGTSAYDLAKKYGVSATRIRQIVSAQSSHTDKEHRP